MHKECVLHQSCLFMIPWLYKQEEKSDADGNKKHMLIAMFVIYLSFTKGDDNFSE